MNDLIIKKEEIDWLKMIKLALDKKGWGKKYVLFNIGNTSVNCMMERFNFPQNLATFKIELDYKDKSIIGNYEYARYYLKNFTLEDFKMHLNKVIITLVNYCIRAETKERAELKYNDKHYYTFRMTDKDIIKTFPKEYEKLKEIEDELIQEELINALKEATKDKLNEEFKELVEEEEKCNVFKIEGSNRIKEACKE